MNARMLLCALAAPAFLAAAASGQIITQWNFNSNPPDSNTGTGTLVPNIGSGTISNIGGTTFTFASGDASGGSSDPATGDDSGWNLTTFPAQGTDSGTAGMQALVSTVGYENIVVSWDLRTSNTGSRYYQFQYTLDASAAMPTWTPFGGDANNVFTSVGGDMWNNGNVVDLSSVPGANNNANFGFRIVSVFSPVGFTTTTAPIATYDPFEAYRAANADDRSYSTAGTWRFDMVTVVPAPGALGLLGLGGVVAVRRRR
jgi:hypothetical protein